MERRYVIPASITLALHAGLLFGFRNPEVRAKAKEEPEPVFACEILMPPIEEEIHPPTDSSGGNPDARPSPRAPELQDIASHDHERITIDIPRRPPSPPGPPGPTIDPGEFNPGDGFGPGLRNIQVIDSRFLDNSPRARFQIAPVFPPDERRAGNPGEVLVAFTVDETGVVTSPRVVRATSPSFGEAALRAVAKWRFEPGLKDGRVVTFQMVVPIVFNLEG